MVKPSRPVSTGLLNFISALAISIDKMVTKPLCLLHNIPPKYSYTSSLLFNTLSEKTDNNLQ